MDAELLVHLQAHFEGWDPLIEDTGTDEPKTIEEWQFMQIVPHLLLFCDWERDV